MKIKGNFINAQNEAKNDQNNAVNFIFSNNVSLNENGPLANVVYSIKDNIATIDAPTTASSRILKHFNPHYNAEIINKLDQAGAIKVFKTNLDEFGLGGQGIYSVNGIITNPLNHEYMVGGSSSGAAASFTNNLGFALGTDTGDSVRLPASFVGKVGFKPSYGAISRYGLFAYASSLDTIGFFTHNVNDAFEVSKTLFGVDKKDFSSVYVKMENITSTMPKKVRILNVTKFLAEPILVAFNKLINDLKNQNINVDIVEPNEYILNLIKPCYEIISYSEACSNLANETGVSFGDRQQGDDWETIIENTRHHGLGTMVQKRLILGSLFLNKENQKELFIKAKKIRNKLKQYYEELQKDVDLVIFPSYWNTAPKFNDKPQNNFMEFILTGANLVGNPSISIPWSKGGQDNMPFNLSLETSIFQDEKLLSHSLWIEELLKKDKK